jgi:2-keto-3-deoxy-galactonokinase
MGSPGILGIRTYKRGFPVRRGTHVRFVETVFDEVKNFLGELGPTDFHLLHQNFLRLTWVEPEVDADADSAERYKKYGYGYGTRWATVLFEVRGVKCLREMIEGKLQHLPLAYGDSGCEAVYIDPVCHP